MTDSPYAYIMIHPEPFLDEPGTFCEEIERDDELYQTAIHNYAQAVERCAQAAQKRIVVCYGEDDAYAIEDGALPVVDGLNPSLDWTAIAVDTHEITARGVAAIQSTLAQSGIQRLVLAGAHRTDCVQRFADLLLAVGYEVALHERALLPRHTQEMASDLSPNQGADPLRLLPTPEPPDSFGLDL